MTTTYIDLAALSRSQLKQLAADVGEELERREHDDRLALTEKLRDLVADAGFDPAEVTFGKSAGRKPRAKTKHSNGENND